MNIFEMVYFPEWLVFYIDIILVSISIANTATFLRISFYIIYTSFPPKDRITVLSFTAPTLMLLSEKLSE